MLALSSVTGAEKKLTAAEPPAQASAPTPPARQADAAFTAILVGTWRVTWPNNGWNAPRTFAADGTFMGSGSGHDEPRQGHWKIEGNQMIITFAEGSNERWQLPLDPSGTTVLGKRDRKMTAVRESPPATTATGRRSRGWDSCSSTRSGTRFPARSGHRGHPRRGSG